MSSMSQALELMCSSIYIYILQMISLMGVEGEMGGIDTTGILQTSSKITNTRHTCLNIRALHVARWAISCCFGSSCDLFDLAKRRLQPRSDEHGCNQIMMRSFCDRGRTEAVRGSRSGAMQMRGREDVIWSLLVDQLGVKNQRRSEFWSTPAPHHARICEPKRVIL
jgi:hypothetical protein